MEKDNHKTKVIFRKSKDGEILALFPELSYRRNYHTTCYQHIGQHGEADYHHCITITKLAKPGEYKDLKIELESLGYDLIVRQKANITYK